MPDPRSRAPRAVLRNALAWGLAWALAGGGIAAVVALLDPRPGVGSLAGRLGLALLAAVAWGVRFGIAGVVIGALFAAVVRLGYRGRRIADIDPWRFALLGAVVGGIGVPLFLQLMNVLSGDGPIAWGLVTDDALWAAPFGAAAAAGFILLARRVDARAHDADEASIARADDRDALPPPGVPEGEIRTRAGVSSARPGAPRP